MLVHQLINGEELDKDFDFISIAPTIAEILEIDQRFVGTFFVGGPHVVFQSNQLDVVHEKQLQLQKLGVYLDIKTIGKGEQPEPQTQASQVNEEHVTPADQQDETANIELSVDKMIEGLALADPESYIKDKNDSYRSPNVSYGELEFDEFDPGFDKHKQLDD